MTVSGAVLLFTTLWLLDVGGLAHAQDVPDNMVVIPAGAFLYGSPDGEGRPDEHPQRTIELSAFAIDRYEVTNERYIAFLRATGHRAPMNVYGSGSLMEEEGIGQLPVVQVTWHDAADFCEWEDKRLPTEAEWEKAARGIDGRRYPWGHEPPTSERANFEREWSGKTTLDPIGSHPAGISPYGVHDMAGNVREWVQDWYDEQAYRHASARNPQGPEHGLLKVIRGGSWRSFASDIRTAARGKGGFALKTHGIGFRCAKDLRIP